MRCPMSRVKSQSRIRVTSKDGEIRTADCAKLYSSLLLNGIGREQADAKF